MGVRREIRHLFTQNDIYRVYIYLSYTLVLDAGTWTDLVPPATSNNVGIRVLVGKHGHIQREVLYINIHLRTLDTSGEPSADLSTVDAFASCVLGRP